MIVRSANCAIEYRRDFMSHTDDLHSLSHTKWNCKYHVVFAPKYRRKAFYDYRRIEIGKILRDLCEWKLISSKQKYA